jgi:hypothetical protein
MGFFGLEPDGPIAPAVPLVYLWPDNLEAWQVFHACGTQWRSGPEGREGLDYAGVRIVMCDIVLVPRKRRQQRMREIHLMEVTALNEWALKRRTEQ